MTRLARDEEMAAVDEYTYTPPNDLDIPFQLKDGFVYRWVRVALVGQEDKSNISTRRQEGFEFVRLDELPDEFQELYTDETAVGRLAGTVRKGDLALMRIPVGKAMARQAYYEGLARNAQRAIRQELLAQNDTVHGRKVPFHDQSYSEVFTGRKARFGEAA